MAARLTGATRSAAHDGVARGAVGTAAINISATGLNFALTVLLTTTLGAHGFGAYAFAFAWSTVLTVPAVLGLSPLIIRSVARYQIEAEWGLLRGVLRHSHAIVLASSLLIVGVAGLVGIVVLTPHSPLLDPYLIGLLLVPLSALTTMRQAAMQGLGRVVLGRVPETVLAPAAFFVLAAIGWILLRTRFSASAALALQVAASAGAFGVGLWLLRRAVPGETRLSEPRYETRAWAGSAARLVAMSLASSLSSQLAVILLGALQGSAQAGIYQATSRVALFVSFLFMAAGYAVAPAIARLLAQNRQAELQALLSRSVQTLFLCSAPVAVGFAVFAPQVLAIFGSAFRGGSDELRILLIGEVFRVGAGFAGAALVMGGHEREVMWVQVAGLALNLALSAVLIPELSGPGAAIATTIALSAVQLATVVYAWRRMSLSSAVFPLPVRRTSSA